MTVQAPAQGGRARPWWPWLKRGITVGFFSLVAYLLVVNAREIEWSEVGAALRKRPLDSLLFAALVAALSHAVYSCYDLLSRRYTGHHLSTGQVLSTTFISYAFNLNLGSLVGALGFRHRLYSRLGLRSGEINRIIAFSMLTNWIGYLLLAGIAFLMRPLDIPQDWALGSGALQVVGGLLLCVVAAYLLSCAFSRQRSWRLRGHEIELPPVRMALLQLAISSTNWLLIAGIVFLLLPGEVAYPTVLAVLLIAAVAGVLTHVPAGLGVLEAVFVALLSRQVPTNELLAALLAYRGIYYLAPLMAATALYLFLEAKISTDSG
ncbi:MAG TPA: lysylphosphatidylglycerol synthase domain-containing protein [Lautropia sp.]|nr:lysylphosphatidylglycerol synthase domain-containing protein [Lautropia sp.]